MTHVNPSPSQFPEVKRESRSNIRLSICFQDWILYVIGALVGITILTFDLATDWLLWRVLSSLWIHDNIRNAASHVVGEREFAARLPLLFLAFVSMATAIYAGHVIYAAALFWLNRVRYRSKLDGIAPKYHTIQFYGADLLTGSQLLLQSLPLTALLFYLQLNVDCRFYFAFQNDALVMLSLASTCTDVIWKCCGTFWNWRHFADDCEQYGGRSGTHALFAIRCFNCMLLCLVFSLVVLNFILISPIQNALPERRLANKLCLDRWVGSDYVIFTIAIDNYIATTGPGDDVNRNASFLYNGTDYTEYEYVVALRPIYEHGSANVIADYDDNNTALLKAIGILSNDVTAPRHCTGVFSFAVRLTDAKIEYNAAYSCHGGCTLRVLNPAVLGTFSNRTSPLRLPVESGGELLGVDFGVLPNITLDASDLANTTRTPPSSIRIFRPHVTLAWKLERKNVPCDVRFVWNEALSLPNVC